MGPTGARRIRAVTHHGIETDHIEQALGVVAQVMA
jgi:hypothetical protein